MTDAPETHYTRSADGTNLAYHITGDGPIHLVFVHGGASRLISCRRNGVGGGTLRDVLLGEIPSVVPRGLYAIPALSAAGCWPTW